MIRMQSAPCLEEIILPMLTHEALNPSILILENIISCHSDKLVCGLILECTPYVFLRVCHNCHHDKLACGPKGEIIILIISYCLCRVFCFIWLLFNCKQWLRLYETDQFNSRLCALFAQSARNHKVDLLADFLYYYLLCQFFEVDFLLCCTCIMSLHVHVLSIYGA